MLRSQLNNYKVNAMRKLAIGLICLGIIACQSENKNNKNIDLAADVNSAAASDSLTYSYDSVKVVSKHVVPIEESFSDTTKAVITFPRFLDADLNKLVEDRVCRNASTPDKSFKTYQELADNFIKGFDDYLSYNEDNIQTWFLDVNVDVLLQTQELLSLKFTQADYMGGAHPNSSFSYLNYDRKDKTILTLDSILKPNTFSKLEHVAEQIFRKNEGLTPTQSLADAYFFDKDVFHLNTNFTLTKNSIEFLYNPYEIKPYAAGTTKLVIPYTVIKDLIKPNSIIYRLNNNAGI
jgi:thioredoxin-related protein